MRHVLIVDANYVFFNQKRIDYLLYKKEVERALQKRIVESHYVENSPNLDTGKQQAFFSWLRAAEPHGPHFQVHILPLRDVIFYCPKCRERTRKQIIDGVETKVISLMLKLAFQDKFDLLILLAGDPIYVETIRYLKDELKRKVVISGFEGAVSLDLQSASDFVIWIDKFYDKIERHRSPGP